MVLGAIVGLLEAVAEALVVAVVKVLEHFSASGDDVGFDCGAVILFVAEGLLFAGEALLFVAEAFRSCLEIVGGIFVVAELCRSCG